MKRSVRKLLYVMGGVKTNDCWSMLVWFDIKGQINLTVFEPYNVTREGKRYIITHSIIVDTLDLMWVDWSFVSKYCEIPVDELEQMGGSYGIRKSKAAYFAGQCYGFEKMDYKTEELTRTEIRRRFDKWVR